MKYPDNWVKLQFNIIDHDGKQKVYKNACNQRFFKQIYPEIKNLYTLW